MKCPLINGTILGDGYQIRKIDFNNLSGCCFAKGQSETGRKEANQKEEKDQWLS